MKPFKLCIDIGHGMSNIKRGVFDPGAVSGSLREADIALEWGNNLRKHCQARGLPCIRTRVDNEDPAPVSRRDDIAVSYGCNLMFSLHCNSGGGTGVEVFFRGEEDRAFAQILSSAVATCLGLKDRGAKTERESQHKSLAVMDFKDAFLIELGFIDNEIDRARLRSDRLQWETCAVLSGLALDYRNVKQGKA